MQRGLTLLAMLALAGCSSSLEQAQDAHLRGNWDAAVEHYTEALASSTDPDEVASIKANLAEAKLEAGAAHLEQSRQAIAVGDVESAYDHAEAAYRYTPTPEVAELLNQVKVSEAERLKVVGEQAIEHSHWKQAVDALKESRSIVPNEEVARLHGYAQNKLTADREAHKKQARAYLSQREWGTALEHYEQAGGSEEVLKERDFAALMVEAEANQAKAESNTLLAISQSSRLRKALGSGIDTEHVQYLLDRITPANYRVNINGAVILPFKPDNNRPWDGAGGEIEGASSLLAGIAASASGGTTLLGGVALKEVTTQVLSLANQGTDAPDCYPVLRADGQTYGGPEWTDQDDLQPSWGLWLAYSGITKADKRVLSIEVRDKDLTDDDNVGSYQVTLEELLREDGPQNIMLVGADGGLKAGGVVVLKVSVEEFTTGQN